MEATSTQDQLFPYMDQFMILMLELSTSDVETVLEVPANSLWDFVGNVAGNLGMFFGTSIYGLQFSSITSYDRHAHIVELCTSTTKTVLLSLQHCRVGNEAGDRTSRSFVSCFHLDNIKLQRVQPKQNQVNILLQFSFPL